MKIESQISFSICRVALVLIHLVIALFQLGNLQTPFFPVCRSQSSKLVEVFGSNCCSGSGLLLGQKMSVQPFPQLLSSHTHAHTHPFFCSFTTVCLQGKWSYPGVRVPGSSQINTLHAWAFKQSALFLGCWVIC